MITGELLVIVITSNLQARTMSVAGRGLDDMVPCLWEKLRARHHHSRAFLGCCSRSTDGRLQAQIEIVYL